MNSLDQVARPLSEWPQQVTDTRFQLEVRSRWLGYQVRTDMWKCRNWVQPWHVLYLTLEGTCAGTVADRPFTFFPGTFLWIPPGTRLTLAWPKVYVFTEIWFRLSNGPKQLTLTEDYALVDRGWDIRPLFDQIADEVTLPRQYSDARIRHLIGLTAIEVLRLRGAAKGEPAQLTMAQRTRLQQYIREHLKHRPSLEELAEVACLSPDYFSRVFRATFGQPPREWMVRERIRAAGRVLKETSLPVYAIADSFGYSDTARFIQQFKQVSGITPHRFRKRP